MKERGELPVEATSELTDNSANNSTSDGLGKQALVYLALEFAWSWLLWIAAIKLHWRKEFLNFGSAGPAIAAMILSFCRQADTSPRAVARWAWFAALIVPCWTVLSLH
jgi:hypothetical protein